ncbi:MAG: LysM peptidoglycan-binding domain-containing protein [Caldilineaceae bacterium]|nr:LysM peptidoglycan-binding domain-containing protein [Caldilineaceae bacterium]
MRLTCHDCGSTIYISAEASNCSECGVDLAGHLAALEYVRECYRQASAETLAGDHEKALAILAQGLSAVNASELHLLAALIHRKQGEYDGMHRHVAAIPVDDPLRPEGEWLLRSHQQKQRAMRQAQKEYTPPAHAGKAARQLSPEFYSVPPTLGSPLRPHARTSHRFWRIAIPVGLLAALILLQQPISAGLALLKARPTLPTLAQPEPTRAVAESAAALASPVTSPTQLPATATREPTTLPTPLPSPTPPLPVAAELPTESAAPPPQIAAANEALAAAVATAAASRFDLQAYLLQVERADLAALEISAVLENGRLQLAGSVPFTSHRLDLLALTAEIPGVAQVDAIDLVVRLPAVYVVVDGDTLWTIAYYLYGDGSRWEELYAANAELLGNSILLAVGMELRVPER